MPVNAVEQRLSGRRFDLPVQLVADATHLLDRRLPMLLRLTHRHVRDSGCRWEKGASHQIWRRWQIARLWWLPPLSLQMTSTMLEWKVLRWICDHLPSATSTSRNALPLLVSR